MFQIMDKIIYTTTVRIHEALNGGCGSMFDCISIDITVMLHSIVFKHNTATYVLTCVLTCDLLHLAQINNKCPSKLDNLR